MFFFVFLYNKKVQQLKSHKVSHYRLSIDMSCRDGVSMAESIEGGEELGKTK
jgi:hypothetical protein